MARSRVELFEQIRRDRRVESFSIRGIGRTAQGASTHGASSVGLAAAAAP